MYTISFEGPDGVGKSTQVELTKKKLESKGYKVHTEHFPRYDTPIGGLIGEILRGEKEMPGFDAMQMLYAADQTDYKCKLEELEKEGYDFVLLDRYDLSTMVYYCSKFNNINLLSVVTSWQNGIIKPDLTLVFCSSSIISDKETYKDLDVFEKDELFMRTIRRTYSSVTKKLRCTRLFGVVNSDKDIPEVSKDILDLIQENCLNI